MAKVWRIIEPELYNELMDIYKQKLLANMTTCDVPMDTEESNIEIETNERTPAPLPTESNVEPSEDIVEWPLTKKQEQREESSEASVEPPPGKYNDDAWDTIEVIRERALEGGRRIKKRRKNSSRVKKVKGQQSGRGKKKVCILEEDIPVCTCTKL